VGRSNEFPLILAEATFGLHASTAQLVPPVRLASVGTRAFAVVGPTVWNNLPADVTSSVFAFSGAAFKCSYLIYLSLTLLFKPLPRGLAAFLYCLWSRKSAQILLLVLNQNAENLCINWKYYISMLSLF
jgi:hypothetical protein